MLEYFRSYSHRYIVCNFVLLPAQKIVSKKNKKKTLFIPASNHWQGHVVEVCGHDVKVCSHDKKFTVTLQKFAAMMQKFVAMMSKFTVRMQKFAATM